MRKWTLRIVGGLAALFVLIQFVPYGRAHTNPPVRQEPAWDSPQTRELAKKACFDCHSNETVWPVYASVAPFSWLVQSHVEEGREKLNFSDITASREADEASEVLQEGEMPPGYYTLLHPSARLAPSETEALIAGLSATLGSEGEGGPLTRREGRGGGRDQDGDED